jgi:integrase
MTALAQAVTEYLQLRRALGYKLEREGRELPRFVEFLERHGATVITTELALAWAIQPADATRRYWNQRLTIVRRFARHMQASDPRTEVPPSDLLPAKKRRAVPYLYSEADIEQLMQAARKIRPPLKSATIETVLGLLAVTGMRIGEVLALDRDDVELPEGRLTVRRDKNGKSREIALHPSTVIALVAYARVRDQLCRHPKDPSPFLISAAGRRLHRQTVGHEFERLRRWCGLDYDTLGRAARIHDLRHTFILRTLLNWYREDADVEAQLPLLSTFLGHVEPSTTYWYFQAAPRLLSLVAERLERTWEEQS